MNIFHWRTKTPQPEVRRPILQCAWCRWWYDNAGFINANKPDWADGDNVSHGCCPDCADHVRRSTREKRVASIHVLIFISLFAICNAQAEVPKLDRPSRSLCALHHNSPSGASNPGKRQVLKMDAAPSCQPVGILSKIARIESGNNPAAIGDNGKARGLYQMHEAAWADVSAKRAKRGLPVHPYCEAFDPEIATLYAAEYLQICQSYLSRGGYPLTQANIYAAWNIGPRRASALKKCHGSLPFTTQRAIKKLEQ